MVTATFSPQPVVMDGRQTIAVTNPITSDLIGTIPVSTPQDVAEAVARARQAQVAWGALPVKERARLVRAWGDLLWADQANAMDVIRRETGKVEAGAFIEVLVVDTIVQYYYTHAPKLLKPQTRKSAFPFVQKAKVYYKPHGVVGIISPWNYPFVLPFMDLIPALIAGNAVVIKPSEITPYSVQYGVELMHQAGIPRDIIQFVHGDGTTGQALVNHVDFVAFTGSTATGRKVAVQAASRLIPYTMELGGKDPSIVLEDADIELTAAGLLRGALENAGQVCISIERVYVVEAIYDRLMESILRQAQALNVGVGDGLDVHMGSMTNTVELERTEKHVLDAIAKGAKVAYGGKRRPDLGPLFLEPIILVNVNHGMDVMRAETFGPVLPIMKVKDAEEAVRLANDSEYGLSASIFSKDLKRAEQLATRLNSGDVNINRTQMVIGTPDLPSGGQGISGVGRRNGPEGLLKYVSAQSILVDNQLGQKPDLSLLDPTTLRLAKLIRSLRRAFPIF